MYVPHPHTPAVELLPLHHHLYQPITFVYLFTYPCIAIQQILGGNIDQVLTFSPSETEICVSFPLADNNIALEEPDRLVFSLTLIDSRPGVQLGEFNTTSIIINDDDGQWCCF